MGLYAIFALFRKIREIGITKGRIIGVISKSVRGQFQTFQAQYTRKPKCSNFY